MFTWLCYISTYELIYDVRNLNRGLQPCWLLPTWTFKIEFLRLNDNVQKVFIIWLKFIALAFCEELSRELWTFTIHLLLKLVGIVLFDTWVNAFENVWMSVYQSRREIWNQWVEDVTFFWLGRYHIINL